MLGPFSTQRDGAISYRGNRVFPPQGDIRDVAVPAGGFGSRVQQFSQEAMWGHLALINHRINIAAHQFFDSLNALFTLLPLTTRMISSPGAVYGREAINYVTDTCPITLRWFDLEETAYLAESSQIYLELALRQRHVSQVYCIYNSFRKEESDPTHLSEFHHIEYEGHVGQEQNVSLALRLVQAIIRGLLDNNEEDLAFFLPAEELPALARMADELEGVARVTFRQALAMLYEDTLDDKYRRFTMQDNFGPWEEVRLTEMVGGMVIVSNFPLLEVPFYHAAVEGEVPEVANNSDFIWPGYREFIGSGRRVESLHELEKKAAIFNLPRQDYAPYIQTRACPDYAPSSGFGLGWERLLHGLLSLPYIWSGCQFPRVHNSLSM
jgi:asparaginyl-tRNA synthetase